LNRVKAVVGSDACAVLTAQTLMLLYLYCCHGHLLEGEVYI